jgi:LacI family transcriptional regulator
MNPESRPGVALLVEASRAYGRQLLRGVSLFARTHATWSLLHQEMTLDSGVPDWLMEANVQGVIARVDRETVGPLRKLNVPIVDVRCERAHSGIPQVETDNRRVAELAFQHLWDRGFRRFAFCGFQYVSYSDARLEVFRQLAADCECSLSVYQSQGKPNTPLTTIEKWGMTDLDAISDWLDTLERPTGLFVCNDIRGQQVLNACRKHQIAVPDDLGVIGVDNDDAICMLCDPPLSSVCPDAERVGYRAAEILHGMMAGTPPEHEVEFIQPMSVCERLSTQVVAVEDRELARVCRFIRQHACDGINVGDVSQFTSLSRRQLERRFREELGRTPHEQITSTQIDRVKQLLRETDMTLEQITPIAGYSHKERLSAVFKRETGGTPGEYRKQNANSSS